MTEPINQKTDVDKRSDARCSVESTPTPKQRAVIERYLKLSDSRPGAPRLSVKSKPNGPLEISQLQAADGAGLALAFGTTDGEVASILLNSLINAACDGTPGHPPSEQDVNGVLATVHGIRANDEIEAMLAAQMVATHFAATRALRRLKGSDMVSQQDSNGNLAVKLLRTFAAQTEAPTGLELGREIPWTVVMRLAATGDGDEDRATMSAGRTAADSFRRRMERRADGQGVLRARGLLASYVVG